MSLKNIATDAEFTAAISSPRPVLVDFWATWCAPCKALNPVLTELAAQYEGRMDFVKVDVEVLPDVANRFQVRSVPTMFVFQGGVVKKQLIGAQSKDRLKAALDSL